MIVCPLFDISLLSLLEFVSIYEHTQTAPNNLSNQLKQVESGAPKLVASDAFASDAPPEIASRIRAPDLPKSTFEKKKVALTVKSEGNGDTASNRIISLEAEGSSPGMMRGSTANLSNMDIVDAVNFDTSDTTIRTPRTLRMNNKKKMNHSEEKGMKSGEVLASFPKVRDEGSKV